MDDQLAFDLQTDSPLLGKVKGDRHTMVYSFFSLKREKVTELPPYDDGRISIRVMGNSSGVATIWDKELLIYCASLIAEKLNQGLQPEPKLVFTAHDFMMTVGLSGGGKNYDRVKESLARLRGTTVITNIETGGEGVDGGFGWIESYRIQYRRTPTGEKAMRSVEVTLCSWLFRAIVNDRQLLTYTPRYFDLSPLGKRLYEIARSGPQNGFRIKLPKLLARTGAEMSLKHFRADIAKFCSGERSIPDFVVTLLEPGLRRALTDDTPKPRSRARLEDMMVGFLPKELADAQFSEDILPDVEDEMAIGPEPVARVIEAEQLLFSAAEAPSRPSKAKPRTSKKKV